MDYPHVENLFYKVIPSEDTDYDKAPPISGETKDFKWHLSKDQLVIEMKSHCAAEEEARGIVDEFLKEWEIVIGLHHGPGNLKFTFMSAKIVDRHPSQERGVINLRASIHDISTTLDAVLHISQDEFLPPLKSFKVSPEVEMMFIRYKMYRDGRESLLGMAYWCLTVMECAAGGRSETADQYRIDYRVLRKVGELCGNRGDAREARKMKGNAGITPLKHAEREWIRAVVKRLILRVGEYAYDPVSKLQLLTMSDFPSFQ